MAFDFDPHPRYERFVTDGECPHCGPVENVSASVDTWSGVAGATCPLCGRTFEL